MDTQWTHTTVLLQESIAAVLTDPNGTYIDATYGRGGHSRLLLSGLSPTGRLIAFDRDAQAVANAQALVATDPRFSIRHAAFSAMDAAQSGMPLGSIAGILMDLGISSPQVDDAVRGFSFMRDGPLDMRMDTRTGESVAQWLSKASEATIAQVIHDYGEERHAKAIAAAIVTARTKKIPLTRTLELANLVASTIHGRQAGQHPATRTFQAFRIFINDELGELERALAATPQLLRSQGRLAVISFHSLEDRRVKQFIASHSKEVYDPRSPQSLMRSGDLQLKFKDLGRTKPSAAEIKANPRSRSAVLRVAERTAFGVSAT
ncbi:MAG: 16S rRNA (cytosine(1402)-N(4))-methyltransferase RsmH [Cytophagales bacterium]|nr:16S rRNA (cytosine(1402)-N(4))-methyltransferase RsmH [Cytophagales bacterium]